jgi:vacuolar-type H+-ATPase subunit F/Vma7
LIYQQTFKVIFGDEMIGFVIGDGEMITGFRLVGVEGTEVSTDEEARQALHNVLLRSDVGVVIISESFSGGPSIREELDKLRQEKITPIIVQVPGSKDAMNETKLSDIVSRLLGIKI